MLKPSPEQPGFIAWSALAVYIVGYACFGFLLAMPTAGLPAIAFTGVVFAVVLLSLAGALASRDGGMKRSFIVAALGALLLTGAVAWAATLAGAKAFSGAVLGAVVWGLAWTIAESKPIAGVMTLALGWVAVVSWATNAAVFLAGVVFMFVSSGCTVIGERLGDRYGTAETFGILVGAAGIGLTLGWMCRDIF
jgi:hypothetical protein